MQVVWLYTQTSFIDSKKFFLLAMFRRIYASCLALYPNIFHRFKHETVWRIYASCLAYPNIFHRFRKNFYRPCFEEYMQVVWLDTQTSFIYSENVFSSWPGQRREARQAALAATDHAAEGEGEVDTRGYACAWCCRKWCCRK